MLIASACLGDSLITLTRCEGIVTKGVEKPTNYRLDFTDLTGHPAQRTLDFGDREYDAVMTFAAWLLADEGDAHEIVERRTKLLREQVPEFMP